MSQPEKTTLTGYGGWIPANVAIYESFIRGLIQLSSTRYEANAKHTDPVAKFEAVIKADPEMVDLWNQIFLQHSPRNKIENIDRMLHMMDEIVVAPPRFYLDDEDTGEPIGVPLYLLFDLCSNTAAGHDLFRKQAFNAALKDLLDAWGKYLTTPDSNKTLTDADDGWFSPAAIAVLEDRGRGKFNATYVCPDPDAVNRGFTSWDGFFTREVQAEARPVDVPEDKTLIHSACESTVYRKQTPVKNHDQFWLKGQPYSVYDMLNRDSMAQAFIGGTVYQAFLSPQDYHRWHSPVDGTIICTQIVPGTYYAVLPDAGAEADDPDLELGDPRGAIIRSQAWLTLSATRAIIYIEADNPVIGTVAFIGVGMVEVSGCEVSVKKDQKVATGDELGMFHFGGSSHALIFGPQVRVTFADNTEVNQHVQVKSIIAQASRQYYTAQSGATGGFITSADHSVGDRVVITDPQSHINIPEGATLTFSKAVDLESNADVTIKGTNGLYITLPEDAESGSQLVWSSKPAAWQVNATSIADTYMIVPAGKDLYWFTADDPIPSVQVKNGPLIKELAEYQWTLKKKADQGRTSE